MGLSFARGRREEHHLRPVALTLLRTAAYLSEPDPGNRAPHAAPGNNRRAALSMTRLENAQERLDAALAKLEQASAGHTADLERELVSTRDHCETLEDRNRNIAQKLDAVIARIHTLLEDRTG
jgi:hypothetical protein